MNSHRLCLAIIATAFVSACATVDQQATSAEPRPERVYATGSRIPVRDRSEATADVQSVDNQGATDMLKGRGVIVPAKGGGGM